MRTINPTLSVVVELNDGNQRKVPGMQKAFSKCQLPCWLYPAIVTTSYLRTTQDFCQADPNRRGANIRAYQPAFALQIAFDITETNRGFNYAALFALYKWRQESPFCLARMKFNTPIRRNRNVSNQKINLYPSFLHCSLYRILRWREISQMEVKENNTKYNLESITQNCFYR